MSSYPKDWSIEKLGDLITHKKGFAFKSKDFKENGFPVVKVKDFTNDSINIETCQYLDSSIAGQFGDYKLKTNDIIISTVGSWPSNPASVVGKVISVPSEVNGALLNQNAVRLRSNPDINQRFIYYKLKSKNFFKFIISRAQGSANQASITLQDIFSYQVHIPSVKEQEVIATILHSFDEKIELMRKQIETLENIAQTIFKEWFVNFNYPNASNRMIDSEFGEIPEGWQISGIRAFVEHKKITVKPKDAPCDDFCHYSIPAYDDDSRPIIEKGEEISSNKYKVVDKSFLVSKLNPSTPRIWTIYSPDEKAVCSTEFQVIKPLDYDVFGFIYGALTSYMMKRELSARAHGTSSSHQRVKPDDILDCPVFLPTKELMIQYSKIANRILEKIDCNRLHIDKLKDTRDTLLPKLLNGSVRVGIEG